jgi:phenylpyruvate tautomerase
MPLIIIKSSTSEISPDSRKEIHDQAETSLSNILKKSRDYVMSILELGQAMSFAGDASAPSAYIEVKNVGILAPETTQILSKEITDNISTKLGVSPDRIYIEYQQSERHMWGWNGSTFQ